MNRRENILSIIVLLVIILLLAISYRWVDGRLYDSGDTMHNGTLCRYEVVTGIRGKGSIQNENE